MNIDIHIKKVRPCATIPAYATSGSAAVDIRAAIEEAVTVPAGGRLAVPSGLAISLPPNAVALLCPRSGLSLKHGITLANSIGVIDSDYRGEILVSLRNTSDTDFPVEPGDRIAQLMVLPVYTAAFHEVEELDETERGTGGFGSTGRQ